MHVRDGKLRAFADGELGAAEAERIEAHLKACDRCGKRLARLRADMAAFDESLRLLEPRQDQRPHAGRALARLQAQTESEEQLSGGVALNRLGLSRNWQRALGGLAAVVVVAVLLSFAPVRAAASELLAVFRLENITILPVSVEDIERLEYASYELGDDFFPGEMDMESEPEEPEFPETLAEASALVGYNVRTPDGLPEPENIMVTGGMTATYTPDLEAMQELFEAAELSPDLVPPEIDGQEFEFVMSDMVTQNWFSDEQDWLTVAQMPSPTANFPDEIDEDALGVAMLQLLGLSPEEAAAMSASIDWGSTLVLPLPADQLTYESVTVDGVDGFFIKQVDEDAEPDLPGYGVLVWQKDGMVYLVTGATDVDRLVEIGNSLH